VFSCGGLSLYLNVSYLLSCMILGIIVANTAKHHEKPFREIKGIIEPFLVIFFFLAGFSFEILSFNTLKTIIIIYVFGRIFGKIIGGYIG
ncbi:sodium:proton exchanger, partial [Enterococcus hirae]